MLLSGDRQLSSSELQANALLAATGFTQMGIGEGDTLAMLLRNDFAFFEATFAANILGAYAVPINWHFQAEEIAYILNDCQAKVLIVHEDLLPQAQAAVPEDFPLLVVDTPSEIIAAYNLSVPPRPEGMTYWQQWLEQQIPWTDAPRPPREAVIYTSGTTGNPKGVRRSPETAEQAEEKKWIVANVFGLGMGADTRTVVTGPIYHSAPNLHALGAAQSGGLVILQPRFNPEALLQLVEEHQINSLHMVPTMFVRLLDLPESVRSKYDLSSLKFVVHAAAPCPVETKQRMIEWVGPILHEYYGGTETGVLVLHNSHEALQKPGTVGKAIPNAELKILGDDGQALPANQVGEIYGVNYLWPDFTYINAPEKRSAIEKEGLMTLGDVGYLDEDGFLFVTDRVKDMIISGGVNIYPAEIEAVLIGMPGVKDCAVFGIPNAEFGESICAHVDVTSAITDEQTIKTWLSERIAKYKIPTTIVFDNALPREDSGKIMKRKIRDRYWADSGKQV